MLKEKVKSQEEVAVVVRLRLPPRAARLVAAMEIGDRSRVVLAGLRLLGLHEEKEPSPVRGEE